jgi:hypothetical protein
MNRAQGWAATGSGNEVDAARGAPATEGAEVIEAVLSWRDARGDNVLARQEAALDAAVAIGEGTPLLVPADVLGCERFVVVRRGMAVVPPGATLRVDGAPSEETTVALSPGHSVEILVEAFVVRLARVRAGTKVASAPLSGLERSGLGIVLASGLAHLAAFAVVAYVSPALGATEGDAYDNDRILLMQRLLDASAQHEVVRPVEDGIGGNDSGEAASLSAEGPEGRAGKPTANTDGKISARSNARPETATPPPLGVLVDSSNFGFGPVLTALSGDRDGIPLAWGKVLEGADNVTIVGQMYGATLDDAMGAGGLGLSGVGLGGGGRAQSIGLGDRIGLLGGMGTCGGGGPCDGVGTSRRHLVGGHVSMVHMPREAGPISTNGHLPAEVIQRIVRQNAGRSRFCYEQGLRGNPTLTGRVTVKFLIARDGSVGFASDGGSDLPDASVTSCVVRSFSNLSFPAPDNGVVTVVYPLTFSPE